MPAPYVNARRRLEELEKAVPTLMAQVDALGSVVTYLVRELGGQVSIPRDSLKELTETHHVTSDSDPESESLDIRLEETKP